MHAGWVKRTIRRHGPCDLESPDVAIKLALVIPTAQEAMLQQNSRSVHFLDIVHALDKLAVHIQIHGFIIQAYVNHIDDVLVVLLENIVEILPAR
jgi:hypothetical protein